MLEVVTLRFNDGGVLAIHAMRMTKQYWRLLEGTVIARKKILGVSGGQPITQADVERMADEAERGYGDDQLRHVGRGRPTLGSGPAKAVQTRLEPDLHAALKRRAKADHKTSSEIVREALHECLSA